MIRAASCLSCIAVFATASMALALPTGPVPVASATSPTPARIPVDASEIGTLSRAALDEIALQATAEAAKHGLRPDQLTISLIVIDHLEVIRGVRVSIVTPTITLADPGGDPRGPLVAQCKACAEAELKTVAIEGVLEALERYEDLRAAAEAAAQPPAEDAAPDPEPSPPDPPAPAPAPTPGAPSRRLHPLGQAGVATLTVGASAVVLGLVFIGLGNDRPPADLPYAQDHVRHFAPPGYVLLGVGSAVAISGAVMLGLDRRRARSSTITLAPQASPTTFGFHLHTRF